MRLRAVHPRALVRTSPRATSPRAALSWERSAEPSSRPGAWRPSPRPSPLDPASARKLGDLARREVAELPALAVPPTARHADVSAVPPQAEVHWASPRSSSRVALRTVHIRSRSPARPRTITPRASVRPSRARAARASSRAGGPLASAAGLSRFTTTMSTLPPSRSPKAAARLVAISGSRAAARQELRSARREHRGAVRWARRRMRPENLRARHALQALYRSSRRRRQSTKPSRSA